MRGDAIGDAGCHRAAAQWQERLLAPAHAPRPAARQDDASDGGLGLIIRHLCHDIDGPNEFRFLRNVANRPAKR
jgi:hypothetical protein